MKKITAGLVTAVCASSAFATDEDFRNLAEAARNLRYVHRGIEPPSEKKEKEETQNNSQNSDASAPPLASSEGWFSSLSLSSWPLEYWKYLQGENQGEESTNQCPKSQEQEERIEDWVLIEKMEKENTYFFRPVDKLPSYKGKEVEQRVIYVEKLDSNLSKLMISINLMESNPVFFPKGSWITKETYELVSLSNKKEIFHGALKIKDSGAVQDKILYALKEEGIIPLTATLAPETS